jgi:acyl-CoA thioester hydrolase
MKIRVYYEDTDAVGIVYHTNYIKYCERARSEVFFEVGLTPSQDENSGFVVKDLKASFWATAKLGDMLNVETKIVRLRGSSVILLQEIYCNETKVFSMEIVLVYISNQKPTRIPEQYRKLLDNYLRL